MKNEPIINKSFGKYSLEKILGDSEFSQTFYAVLKDGSDTEPYVVRRFRRNISGNDQFLRYFKFVLKVHSGLKHDSIPIYKDSGKIGEHFFTARKFLNGYTAIDMIDHSLRGDTKLSGETIHALIVQVISVLHYSNHLKVSDKLTGVTHSNLSPSNIVLTENGSIKITDFRPPFSRPDVLKDFGIMPLNRISPDMIANKPVGVGSEVFFIGLLLYELVYNDTFFTGIESFEQLTTEIDRKLPIKAEPPVGSLLNINQVIAALLDINSGNEINDFTALSDRINQEWGDLSLEKSEERLNNYYQKLKQDKIHDIIEDFKEEIEESIDVECFDDIKTDPEIEINNVQPEPAEVPDKAHLDYEAFGADVLVKELDEIKKDLTSDPQNEELQKAAIAKIGEINECYRVHNYFNRASLAIRESDITSALVNYSFILGLDSENTRALDEINKITDTATESSSESMDDDIEESEDKTENYDEVYAAGAALISERKYGEAIESLNTIPESSEMYEQALNLIKDAEKKTRIKDNETAYKEGLKLVRENKFEPAIQLFTQILANDPNHFPSIEAIEIAQQKLINTQNTVNRLLEEASGFVSEEQYESALDSWKQVLDVDPDNQKVMDYIHETEELISKRKLIDTYIENANDLESSKEYDKAIKEFEKALEFDPDNEEVQGKIEEVRRQIAESEKSQNEIEEQLPKQDDDQDSVRALLDKGLKAYGEGEFKEAVATWNEVLSINPSHEQALEYIELANEELDETPDVSDDSDPMVPSAEIDDEQAEPEYSEEVPEFDYDYQKDASITEKPDDEKSRDEKLPENEAKEEIIEEIPVFEEVSETTTSEIQESPEISSEITDKIELNNSLPEEELPELKITDDVPDIVDDESEGFADSDTITPEEIEFDQDIEQISDEISQDFEIPSEESDAEHEQKTAEQLNEEDIIEEEEKQKTEKIKVEELYVQGMHFYEDLNFQDAIQKWHEVLELDPEHKKAKLLLEKAKIKLTEKSERDLTTELPLKSPKSKRNYLLIGLGVIVVIVIIISSYIGLNSYTTSKYKTQAFQAFTNGDYSKSVKDFELYLQREPDDTSAIEKLSESYLNLGQPGKAIAALSKINGSSDNNSNIQGLLASAYYQNGEYNKALKEYTKANRENPQSIELLLGLAKTYYKLGKTTRAMEEFERVKQLGSENISDEDWIVLGQVLYDIGKYEESNAAYFEVSSQNFDSLFGSGRCLFQQNIFEEAADKFSQAKDLDKKSVDNRLYLGKTYYRLKNYEGAITEYLDIIEGFPEDIDVYLELGTAYLKIGQHENAIEYYQKALKIHPNDAKLHFSLGYAYHEQGNTEKAIEEYKHAYSVKKDYAEALANLGIVYFGNNDREAAKKAWFESLKANPDQPQIQAYLRRMGAK